MTKLTKFIFLDFKEAKTFQTKKEVEEEFLAIPLKPIYLSIILIT